MSTTTTPHGIRVFWIAAIAMALMISTGLFLVYREAPTAAGAMPVIVELDLSDLPQDAAPPSIRIDPGTTHLALVLPVPDVRAKFDIVMSSPDGITRPSRATSLDVDRRLARVVLDAKRCSEAGRYTMTIGSADGNGTQHDYSFQVE